MLFKIAFIALFTWSAFPSIYWSFVFNSFELWCWENNDIKEKDAGESVEQAESTTEIVKEEASGKLQKSGEASNEPEKSKGSASTVLIHHGILGLK